MGQTMEMEEIMDNGEREGGSPENATLLTYNLSRSIRCRYRG